MNKNPLIYFDVKIVSIRFMLKFISIISTQYGAWIRDIDDCKKAIDVCNEEIELRIQNNLS